MAKAGLTPATGHVWRAPCRLLTTHARLTLGSSVTSRDDATHRQTGAVWRLDAPELRRRDVMTSTSALPMGQPQS
jgi:hypothetical protein